MQDTTKEFFLQRKEEVAALSRETKSVTTTKTTITTVETSVLTTIKPVVDFAENFVSKVTYPSLVTTQPKPQPYVPSDDILTNVSRAINDTSLPAKQPLQRHDPFNYITSRDFVVSFIFFFVASPSLGPAGIVLLVSISPSTYPQ